MIKRFLLGFPILLISVLVLAQLIQSGSISKNEKEVKGVVETKSQSISQSSLSSNSAKSSNSK